MRSFWSISTESIYFHSDLNYSIKDKQAYLEAEFLYLFRKGGDRGMQARRRIIFCFLALAVAAMPGAVVAADVDMFAEGAYTASGLAAGEPGGRAGGAEAAEEGLAGYARS